ncbi:hypothetical protein CYLTODRAFT_451203 [Cylindrobasidium torrendii FP15055 ss-10]|uniref:Uncharacterized protein n=1 Tax=Cylindrobasidium torrendii FP15055 ss-10 TaxID=1314674 RepID=A0A0D7BK92_9AGAR|nr:hypothetical protein CYLTODRAFT_451203 [Cylindrobasidium torrendii FP15055 ss-10]
MIRTASIAQGYRACPVDNCPCPYHRINLPEPDDFTTASAALQAFGTLRITNEQPTPGEEASILASIRSLSTSRNGIHSILVELEETRRIIESRIKSYRDSKLQLDQSIDEHRFLLSPVRRLSVELLVEIFSHVVEEELFDPIEQSIHPTALRTQHSPSPVPNLALTCRRWNKVVLGTPKLWSHINIDLCEENIPEPDDLSQYYGKLSRHFMRTARTGFPLTISIGTCYAADEDYDLNPITFLLPSYAARITHLTLFLPPSALERMNLIGPQLTSLVYATVANTAPDETEEGFKAFMQCTTLHTFNAINFDSLDDVYIPTSVKYLSLRHHSIPHSNRDHHQLEDDSYGLPAQIRKLTPLTGLETLCIDIGGNNVDLPHGTHLSLPKLKKLTIVSHCNKPLYVLLQRITVPSLENLSLSSLLGSTNSFTAHYFQSLGGMAERSACPLTSLKIVFQNQASVGPMMAALYQLPKLQHLTIRRRAKSGVIRLLGSNELQKDGRIMLPALQTLVLDAAPFVTDALRVLADWIEARVETRAPLKKVVIVSRVREIGAVEKIETDRMAWFRERLEKLDGLDVRAEFSKTEGFQ